MLLMFIAAVAVLMASSGHRKWSWCLKENVHKVLSRTCTKYLINHDCQCFPFLLDYINI
jgi:hypothetical protein